MRRPQNQAAPCVNLKFMSKIQSRKAVEIKIATVVAVVLILRDTDLAAIEAAMQEITGGEADYFDNELAVVDVASFDLADQAIDWAALITLFKAHSLHLAAVRNAKPEMEASIVAHGMSLDASVKSRPAAETPALAEAVLEVAALSDEAEPAVQAALEFVSPVEIAAEPAAQAVPVAAPAPAAAKPGAMIVDTPVRGGQRIYARGCDLIVTAIVNPGAELIADGSIHIYAPLRGRALAGASGDASARIFAMSMEAELVSIAGMYRTFDEGWPKNLVHQAVQVSLVGDRIDLRPMTPGAR